MSKHTPGSWRAVHHPGVGKRPHWNILAGSDHSILITSLKGYDAEDEANARLIAAASDLLHAVENAASYFHDLSETLRNLVDDDAASVAVEARNEMRAILKRIEGE